MLNQNLTTRVPIWNPTDDYYYVNGKRSIKAWLNSVNVWVDGNFGVSVDNGTHRTKHETQALYAFTVGDNLTAGITNVNQAHTLTTSEQINFSNYSRVTVKEALNDWVLNTSGYNGLGYLCIAFSSDSQGNTYRFVGISSSKDYFGENIINNLQTTMTSPTLRNVTIREIIVE